MAEGEKPDDSQKTEEPTPKKLEEARKKGQVALSREMNTWIMLLMATIIVGAAFGPMMSSLFELMHALMQRAADMPGAPGGLPLVMGGVFRETFKALALPIILLMLAAFLAPFIQVGALFAPEMIKPDLGKISLIKGFARLFSMRSLVEFGKGILKLGLVGIVGLAVLYPYFDKFEHFIGLPMPMLLEEIKILVMRLLIAVVVVLFAIAVADLLYQRLEHYKKMRMTKQELRDEYKQAEGDPQVKAKLRQLRAERARKRMMQNVPKADVVITNPTHFSIALQYDSETMEAPLCLAKGVDDIALRIREVAKEHDIVLFENAPLARALYDTVEIDDTIPPEHYKAVAEVISYVYKMRGQPHKPG